ncbi:Sbal_3080 family lipoprotein [Neptunicella sp. SCSIO 80796]|uniref:Sbal_3080 family lipoprotein n=1 Tax=Neptunicella plasticusilytica TaxID=3117012 RepID=UPI003A4DE2A3
MNTYNYNFKLFFVVIALLGLGGCAARQEITQLTDYVPQKVCIAKNDAVREGVIKALEKGFAKHNVDTMVVNATYVEKHGALTPSISDDQSKNCETLVFYTANWHWDLAMYMRFANVWLMDESMQAKLAQATYTAGAGLDKFIDAEEKIIELVDEMFKQKT